MKRTRVRPRSEKREAVHDDRADLVRTILELRPYCEVRWDQGCRLRSEHVHEPRTRARGGSILDPDNTVATCGHCHDRIHANPFKARELGFLKASWDA